MITTDDFTTAAWEHWDTLPYTTTPSMAYAEGVNWARSYLASQEPTDAEVDAAAIALYNDDESWGFVVEFAYGTQAADWDDLGPGPQQMFRDFARRALSAATRAREDPTR